MKLFNLTSLSWNMKNSSNTNMVTLPLKHIPKDLPLWQGSFFWLQFLLPKEITCRWLFQSRKQNLFHNDFIFLSAKVLLHFINSVVDRNLLMIINLAFSFLFGFSCLFFFFLNYQLPPCLTTTIHRRIASFSDLQ